MNEQIIIILMVYWFFCLGYTYAKMQMVCAFDKRKMNWFDFAGVVIWCWLVTPIVIMRIYEAPTEKDAE